MSWINPINLFRLLYRRQIEVYYDGFLIASDDYAQKRLIRTRVDFLMGYKRRHVNEIPRARIGKELQAIAPTHPCSTADDINDTFKFTVMMRCRLGIGMNIGSPSPKFIGSGSSVIDRRRPGHARGLESVEIELSRWNDLDPMITPIALR